MWWISVMVVVSVVVSVGELLAVYGGVVDSRAGEVDTAGIGRGERARNREGWDAVPVVLR
jgi:hypothetical protein